MRLLIVPRWAGSAESDFYLWLQRQLHEQHPTLFSNVVFAVLQNPPALQESLQAVRAALSEAPAETLVMGHSVGFQAVMRALAELTSPVAGLFGVAPWWSVDKPWPSIMPWLETPFEHQRTQQNATRRMVVLSDNDPFTADYRETRRLFEERISAQVEVIPDGKHFNQAEEPAVLEALVRFAQGLQRKE